MLKKTAELLGLLQQSHSDLVRTSALQKSLVAERSLSSFVQIKVSVTILNVQPWTSALGEHVSPVDPDSWLGVYVGYTASFLTWIKVSEWLHSTRKTAIIVKLISLRNVCLSHFKIPSIFSILKRQHLRAKLLKNHFIVAAKVHCIMQWENAVMLGARTTYTKAQSHCENDKSCWYFHALSPADFGHIPSHNMPM